MAKVIFTHVYVIVVAIFIVMTGNILADNYGTEILSKITSIKDSADREVRDVKSTVKDWNKNILD
jgi:hypothetical protein